LNNLIILDGNFSEKLKFYEKATLLIDKATEEKDAEDEF